MSKREGKELLKDLENVLAACGVMAEKDAEFKKEFFQIFKTYPDNLFTDIAESYTQKPTWELVEPHYSSIEKKYSEKYGVKFNEWLYEHGVNVGYAAYLDLEKETAAQVEPLYAYEFVELYENKLEDLFEKAAESIYDKHVE